VREALSQGDWWLLGGSAGAIDRCHDASRVVGERVGRAAVGRSDLDLGEVEQLRPHAVAGSLHRAGDGPSQPARTG
jgi:hypothetical protein